MVLMFGFQFYFEGLMRTRLFLVTSLAAVLGFALLIPAAWYLPLPVQRSLAVFPLLHLDPGRPGPTLRERRSGA